MRTVSVRVALVGAVLALTGIAAAADEPETKSAPKPKFVVTCKLIQPQHERRLVVAAAAEGKQTEIPVRVQVNDEKSPLTAEVDELRFDVPGTDRAESVRVGHQIQVKISEPKADRVRLDAAVEYHGVKREGEDDFRAAGQKGRYVGEVLTGRPVSIVLETNDAGEPKHWVELVVRFADEKAQQRAEELTRTYSVVYSVAGLVGVERKAKPGKRPELDFAPLIKKIERKISPDTWAKAGGEGKIQPFARTASIVVMQTAAVHEELAAYLTRLKEDEEAIQEAILEAQ